MPKKTSNNNDKRLEILGVLFLAISTFVIISMLGHDTNEELSISPNAKINNPMGILGVLVSHLLIKLGLGYASLVIPLLCAYWGWAFFSKIEIEQPLKISFYALISMLLTSITIAVFSIHYNLGPAPFHYSGVLAGVLGDFFLDMFSIYGSIIFITASYLMIIRAYFDLDFYKPFQLLKEKVFILWNDFSKNRDLNAKENEKRKHTNELNNLNKEFRNEKLTINIKSYYFSNVIARSSKTMLDCHNSKLDIKRTGTNG